MHEQRNERPVFHQSRSANQRPFYSQKNEPVNSRKSFASLSQTLRLCQLRIFFLSNQQSRTASTASAIRACDALFDFKLDQLEHCSLCFESELLDEGNHQDVAMANCNERNTALYGQYTELAAQKGRVVFARRFGNYKHYGMNKAIAAAFKLAKAELGESGAVVIE